VPFEIIRLSRVMRDTASAAATLARSLRPGKAQYEIIFPRVEGYSQAIRNRVAVDWTRSPRYCLIR